MSETHETVAVGGELGTSSCKFCCEDTVLLFSSVVGDALTESMENSWRHMNRSVDSRWVRNLAVFDDSRSAWRYVGAMTRRSEKTDWFTHKGLITNHDDAFVAIKAGLFLLFLEMEKKGKPLDRIGLGFGITVRHGENVIEKFFAYIKDHLVVRDGKKYLAIKAKNVALNEVREIEIQMDFCVMQYQAYGAYMALLFSKYNMAVQNTYVVDIGHGTWIKLPIIDNEAEIGLSDSFTEGIFTITRNISNVIFESSGQKFKIPEQRLMERLPSKDYKIEVPGTGFFDFTKLLQQQTAVLARNISDKIAVDIATLSAKGQSIDYFIIIGGGAHLLFEGIKKNIGEYFNWSQEILDQRVMGAEATGVDPRHINCVGFMLLARDQIAMDSGKDVVPGFSVTNIIQEF
ncbi:hypothetical protein WDW37_15110 [Bdellovibrionota bacterium FG-1]